MEAEYAVAFSLETRTGSSYELITRRRGLKGEWAALPSVDQSRQCVGHTATGILVSAFI